MAKARSPVVFNLDSGAANRIKQPVIWLGSRCRNNTSDDITTTMGLEVLL